jgi:RNA polymerase sigma-70 factor (ECF subfamily)
MAETPERDLIQRCLRGDAAAWDEVFDRHYGPTTAFVWQLSPELAREDVEEICQEAFLAVVRNLAGFHQHSRLQTWIFRVAANKARDFLDRTRAAKRGGGIAPEVLQTPDPETGEGVDPPSLAPTPDAQLMSREQLGAVRAALDRLGDACREIVELRYFGDLSYEELGAALHLNVKTVSSRLSKCLDRLESILSPLLARLASLPGDDAAPNEGRRSGIPV